MSGWWRASVNGEPWRLFPSEREAREYVARRIRSGKDSARVRPIGDLAPDEQQ